MDKIASLTEKARKEAIVIAMGDARMREREKEWQRLRKAS